MPMQIVYEDSINEIVGGYSRGMAVTYRRGEPVEPEAGMGRT